MQPPPRAAGMDPVELLRRAQQRARRCRAQEFRRCSIATLPPSGGVFVSRYTKAAS